MSSDAISALAVVFDCGVTWSACSKDKFGSLIEQLLLFLNTYHLHAANNLLLVLAHHPSTVRQVWPPSDSDEPATPSAPQMLRTAMADCLQHLAAEDVAQTDAPPGSDAAAPLLSAALSTAVCRLQRVRRLRPKVEPRILVVHASADAPTQHLPAMNCVFAAQKLGVLIDAVLLGSDDSMLLQQAAHLTGGLYLRPDEPTRSALGQYLITCCLPDRYARQTLRPPPQGQPETRALCHLSKQPVEMGHACSVCLTVFEHDQLPSCPVCGTRYALAPQGRKLLKRPAAGAGGPAAPARRPAPAGGAGRAATPTS